MKRLIFCFDGSWNRLNTECPTNVVLMAESIAPTARDGTPQLVYYDEGVGTGKWWDRLTGGAFGSGLMTNLREAYRFLIFNYEPGDEIFAFGFSRGAYTARSFAGFIRHVGVLDVNSASQINIALKLYRAAMGEAGDDHPDARRFRAMHSSQVCVSEDDEFWRCEYWDGYAAGSAKLLTIKYVGVWDTVGSLGWPNVLPGAGRLNRRLGFHDVALTSKVQTARHALALDERRKLFRPTIWNNVAELNSRRGVSSYQPDAPYRQRWFPGEHGSVGGGGRERGLSDSALSWILAGARRAGLDVHIRAGSRIYGIAPNAYAPLRNDPELAWHDRGIVGRIKHGLLDADREGPTDLNDVSATARQRWYDDGSRLPEKALYRPESLIALAQALEEIRPREPAFEIKAATRHAVVKGDSLPKIAKLYLGDAKHEMAIFEANEDLIDDPNEIHVGWVLRIPEVDISPPNPR